jgi:hypothetical protein
LCVFAQNHDMISRERFRGLGLTEPFRSSKTMKPLKTLMKPNSSLDSRHGKRKKPLSPEFARARFSHASVDRKIIRRQREKSMEDDLVE